MNLQFGQGLAPSVDSGNLSLKLESHEGWLTRVWRLMMASDFHLEHLCMVYPYVLSTSSWHGDQVWKASIP